MQGQKPTPCQGWHTRAGGYPAGYVAKCILDARHVGEGTNHRDAWGGAWPITDEERDAAAAAAGRTAESDVREDR